MKLRIFLSLAILGSMALLPWWITMLIGVVGIVMFPVFYEIIALAFLYDLAYGDPALAPTPFFSTLVMIAVLIIVETVREMIIFYR